MQGGVDMATSSFLTEVKIENDSEAEQLASALESAEDSAIWKPSVGTPCSDASREEIRIFFNNAS